MTNTTPDVTRTRGLALLRAGIAVVILFIVGGGGWIAWKAIQNPDVRLKQPSWFDGTFDHSYWSPLLLGVFGGAALVGVVLWTAYKRLQRGEDLFANRSGQGIRRRGERYSD